MALLICLAALGIVAGALWAWWENRPYYIDREPKYREIKDLWRWRK